MIPPASSGFEAGCQGKASSLRCSALVSMVESTDSGQLDDFTYRGRLNSSLVGSILVQIKVSPGELVVVDPVSQEPAEVAFAEDDDVIETLASYRADEALDVGILPR